MDHVDLNKRGVGKFNTKDYQGALQDFEEAIKINPQEKLYYANKANTLIQLKRYDEAILTTEEALRIDPNYQSAKDLKATALNERGDSKYRAKDYQEAYQDYEDAIKIKPQKELYYANKAYALTRLNRYYEAILSAEAALMLDPNYQIAKDSKAFALNARGVDKFNTKDYQGALQDSEDAIKLNPQKKLYYANKAGALIQLNHYHEAILAAEEALSIDPNYQYAKDKKTEALNVRGYVTTSIAIGSFIGFLGIIIIALYRSCRDGDQAQDLERYNDAIISATRALDIDPNNKDAKNSKASALNARGHIKHNIRDYQGALQDLDVAIEINPQEKLYYANKATILNRLKSYDKAIISAEEALRLDPNYQIAKDMKALALNARGNSKYNANDYQGALQDYEDAIEIKPKEKLYYAKAYALIQLNRYDEAILAVEEALRIDPNYKKVFVLNMMGVIKFNANDYQGALQDFEAAIEINPQEKLYYANKADALIQLKHYDEAIFAVEKALRLDPNYQIAKDMKALALYARGNSKYNAKDYQGALQDYEAAIEINPKEKMYYADKAYALIQLKHYDEAILAVEEALRLDPNCQIAVDRKAFALNERGNSKYNANDYQGALQDFEAAIKINPQEKLYYTNKANVLLRLNHYDEAILAAEEALRIDPNYQFAKDGKALALSARSNIKYNAMDYQGALQDSEDAIKINHQEKLYYTNKADALIRLNRYDEAMLAAEEALRIDPNYQFMNDQKAQALNVRGSIKYTARDFQGALQDFEAAIEINPREKVHHINKASVLVALKSYDKAMISAEEALRIDPNWQIAKDKKVFVLNVMGVIKFNANDYQGALQDFEAAIEINPQEKLYYANKASVLNALWDYDKAILAADEALRLDPNYQSAKDSKAIALDRRGDAKSDKGDYEGALQDYEDAIKTEPSEVNLIEYRISRLSALRELERYDDVIRSATEILDTGHITKAQRVIVLNMRGDVKYNAKDYQGALQDYYEAREIDPSLGPNHNIARILEAKQDEHLLMGSASIARGYLYGNAIEEYSVESMNTLLRLRLSQVAMVYDETPELLEARVIRSYNDVKAISYGTAQVTVLPLLVPSVQEAGLMHWVGMIFERNLYSIKAFYLDSENQELQKGLAKAITGQLESSNPSLSISFEQTAVKQQSYNNCGPELIENIALHLTGVRVSQEESMQLHSLLYASYLTNENLEVKKAIAMVNPDAATVAKPYPQAESSFDIKTWLTDAAQWANGKLDSYLKPFLMAGGYYELQAIADKYKVGIEVVDQSTARQAFKKISLIVHPDKASISDAHTSLEEMHRDYLRAEELSNNKAGSALGLETYSPVMSKLQTMYRGIRIVDSMLDTVKAIRDPNEGTISKAVIGYGYIAENFLGRSIGMQYIAPLDIGFKVYQGDYKAAVKSCVLLAGHMLPTMLMPVAPAAAVAITGGFILEAAYDTAIKTYNELSGAYKLTNAIED
jgi:tetratricopeptide (TPR) repeat protein